jgi:single-stranded-DNA-specific exonuclease
MPAWALRDVDTHSLNELCSTLELHPLAVRLLLIRGFDDALKVQRFLDPQLAHIRPPGTMADFQKTVDRLLLAIQTGETIGVFGDYDVDGVTSAAVVGEFLEKSSANIFMRVARRDEGYGFDENQAEEMVERGAKVLVLTDCGTSDLAAVKRASELGTDVIALDHHRVVDDEAWPGFALVNPQRPDCDFPFKGLCSAGIAFYLMAGLRSALAEDGKKAADPRLLLDLVALGTVADVAPLKDENRILVAKGLEVLGHTERSGLRELMRLGQVSFGAATSADIGWRLGPRLNAPGRLGDADLALRCLTREGAEGEQAARECDTVNEERKDLQKRILDEAMEQAKANEGHDFVLAAGQGWHPGVVGIVAGRLADAFQRPAAVVALDGETGRASARSVPGVDLVSILEECGDHLIRFGGHAAAAGFSVEEQKLEALREALNRVTGERLGDSDTPALELDGTVALQSIDFDLFNELARLGPYGNGNSEPKLAASGVEVINASVVGQGHLRMVLGQQGKTVASIGFGMGDRVPDAGQRIDVAFVLQRDDYRGPRLQMRLLDWQPEGEGIGS